MQSMTATIDPIRVMRRHMRLMVASIAIGGMLGTISHFAFSRFYSLYTGEVLFELQPGLQDPTDIGTVDIAYGAIYEI